jgi:hypothetical protein
MFIKNEIISITYNENINETEIKVLNHHPTINLPIVIFPRIHNMLKIFSSPIW